MKPISKVFHIKNETTPFDFPKCRGSVSIGGGKHRYNLLELYAGFDIETTNTNQVDKDFYGWYAYAYHFQLSLFSKYERYTYLFREWSALLWFFDKIIDHFNLGNDTHIIVWIANFSFEFQFLRRRLNWSRGEYDFFAKEERQPLKATYKGIEFREALLISGGSLAQLAKDYCQTQKLITYNEKGEKISDLDYSIERNFLTPLTDLEEQYCINDVVILAEFSEFIFKTYIKPEHYIPMTKTSILLTQLKQYFRELCKKRDSKMHLPAYYSELEYKKYIQACFPDFDTYYNWMHFLFRGGYVHGNATYAGVTVESLMFDITSHYPTRINLDYFPRTPFKKLHQDTGLLTAEMESLLKTKCCIIHAIFDFVESTTEHSIESKNKCVQALGAKWDNGRLFSCDLLEVWLTELDYDTYTKFYKWAGVTILEFYTSERGKQPPFVIELLNKLYAEKNALKKAGLNNTPEYAIKKAGVNTVYGAEVKRIRIQQTKYDFDRNIWFSENKEPDFEKERAKQILLPQFGIWVTSHARHEILSVIYKLAIHNIPVYYSDTDSIKFHPCHKARDIIKHYNRKIAKRRKNRGLRNATFSDLGEFDPEAKGETVKFKQNGAKRYLYEYKGVVIATIAGMPKSAIYKIGSTNEMIFDEFSLAGFSLTPEQSGKLTTRYNDTPHDAYINGVLMHEESSVALFKIPFKMTVSPEYTAIIEERKEQRCKL